MSNRHDAVWSLLFGSLLAVVPACSDDFFFDDGNDDDTSDDSGDGDGDGETGELPPTEGFLIYPKVLLQDASAVVSIESNGVVPEPCPLSDEGGYLCDADGLVGPTATVRVERSGFEPAVRQPMIQFNQIIPVDVHLLVEGAEFGTWSACAPIDQHLDCAAVCETMLGVCFAAGCETEDPETPVATMQTFSTMDCSDRAPFDHLANSCHVELAGGTVAAAAVRCCCEA